MGDFSSYYKYEKFEVIGDELIPLGIYSIDADGTMPYVVKEECDTACGCIEPQYRWIQTEDTICIEVLTQTVSGSPYCVGYDRYEDVYSQVSYDNGVTWETTATTSTMIEENSSACGYVPPTPTTEYRWVDDGGTTCVGVDKYNRKVKQVSYDGGSTWMNVSPLTVSATTLVEANSPDCGYIAPQYRTISGDPYCNGVDKYEDVYSQVSYDGGSSWETTATTATLVQAKSTDCGFSARTVSTATTCVGVDKHYLDEYQESSDSGATWTTISSSTGTLIEAKSADCGYAERTISGTPYCDGDDLVVVTSAQTSSDSGSTWTTVSTAITMVESGSSQCHQTVHVTGVTLNKNSMSLNSGSSETLVATVSPSNADDKSVTWSSNNTSVATVNSSGLVSAVTSGSATITVTTTDGGYTAQCSVSVSVPTPPTPVSGKFRLTLSDSSTVSAECDSTSAITSGEVSSQYSGTVVSAEIGNCVTSIGYRAFRRCTGLTNCTIGSGVTSIGTEAFRDCRSLLSIDIPNSVTSIGQNAFQYCSGLTNCTIGSGVTSIGDRAFQPCNSLTSVTVDSNNTVYDSRNNCNAIIETSTNMLVQGCKNSVIPNTVTSIGNSAFCECYYLENIVIPNSVTSIGDSAFGHCVSLSDITIPDSVTSIGQYAFDSCARVTSITIGNSVTTIGYASFFGCSSATTLTIGNNVTSIGDYAFNNCEALTSITIPDSVTTIGDDAFNACLYATSLTIGSGVTSIGNGAFGNCAGLTSITINATTPPALAYEYEFYASNCPIYVPAASVDTYKAATNWSTYASRIQPIT